MPPAPALTLHGVVFDILVWRVQGRPFACPDQPAGWVEPLGTILGNHHLAALSREAPQHPQRSGFFSSEKRSGSSPIEGCSIGASTGVMTRAEGRSPMPGSFGTSRCEVAPRQRSSTAETKCMSWPAATDG